MEDGCVVGNLAEANSSFPLASLHCLLLLAAQGRVASATRQVEATQWANTPDSDKVVGEVGEAAGSSHEAVPTRTGVALVKPCPTTFPMLPTQTSVVHRLITVNIRAEVWLAAPGPVLEPGGGLGGEEAAYTGGRG